MNTQLSLTGKTYTSEALDAAYRGVIFTGIAAIVAALDGMFVILKDGQVLELDLGNAKAMAVNLTNHGITEPAELLDTALTMIADAAPQYDVALPEPEPRWTADIKAIDVHGEKYTASVQFDEVDALRDIIEKGPEFGPGYTAEIKLSYALA